MQATTPTIETPRQVLMTAPMNGECPYPLILFSGMGADARLFRLQMPAFPHLIVPDWLTPEPCETLPEYGRRMAEHLVVDGPCFVGGASFGGMVALEVARHLRTKACFLISSIRSPKELPWRYRCLRPFTLLMPGVCVDVSTYFARWAMGVADLVFAPAALSPLRVIAEEQGAFHRWAGVAVLRWSPSPSPPPFPIFQIHGSNDRVFDVRHTKADTIVPGGGHLLPLTHPQIINRFLKQGMKQQHADEKERR